MVDVGFVVDVGFCIHVRSSHLYINDVSFPLLLIYTVLFDHSFCESQYLALAY